MRRTLIDLTVRCRADVKPLRAVLRLAGSIGARANRLRFERLDRPVLVHLPGNHAFDVILHIHNVDNIDVPAACTLIFKAAVVAVTAEPRHRLFARFDRQDTETFISAAVKLKKHFSAFRFNDRHPRTAAADSLAAKPVRRRFRFVQAAIAANAHVKRAALIGSKPITILHSSTRRIIVIVKCIRELGVIRLICRHGDFFIRPRQFAQLFEITARVKIPQRISAES